MFHHTPLHQDLYYYCEGGGAFSLIAANLSGDASSYNWTAPMAATTAGRIKVVVWDAPGNHAGDMCDGNFTIQEGPPLNNGLLQNYFLIGGWAFAHEGVYVFTNNVGRTALATQASSTRAFGGQGQSTDISGRTQMESVCGPVNSQRLVSACALGLTTISTSGHLRICVLIATTSFLISSVLLIAYGFPIRRFALLSASNTGEQACPLK